MVVFIIVLKVFTYNIDEKDTAGVYSCIYNLIRNVCNAIGNGNLYK